ncbi:MAG: histidine kinase [Acidobacteriaceae bacterium]|nr:histidine kinase [Acidobacteriaceae bacterium]
MKTTLRARVLLAAATVLVLICLSALLYWNSAQLEMRHFNQINAMSLSPWNVYGGTWQVGSGLVRNNSDDRGAKLLAGSSTWRDYSFTSDLHFDSDLGDMGVIVRSNHAEEGVDSYEGYYVGLRTTDGMLVVGRSDFGWIETRPIPMPGGVHASAWYRISVTVVGCHLAAFAENLSTGQRAFAALKDDNCLTRGQVGVRSLATGGMWRNINVQPANIADYQQLEAHAGGLRSLELPRREADYNRGFHFSVSAPNKPVEASDATPLIHIADIGNMPRGGMYPVRLHGIVTLTSPALFVQDSNDAVLVRASRDVHLNVGDAVEVTGLAEPKPFGNIIQNAVVRLLWTGTSVPPIAVTPAQAASGAYEAKFVETEARLIAQSENSNGDVVLELTDDSQNFRALLSAQMAHAMPRIEQNSLLRIRGICVLDRDVTRDLTPFVLLPRSANDVQVLASAPWWTPWHVGLCFAAIFALVVAAQMIYYRVHQGRVRAVTQERERLAHEIHDTMAQSFAGVGYQIQGIRSRVAKGEWIAQTQITDQLDVAYHLVRRCHEEASRTISMLGTASPEVQNDLLGSLSATALRIAGTPIDVSTTVEGDVYPLHLRCANALQMIGQEAISNALGHGGATALELALKVQDNRVQMTVRDNGKGFDTGRKYAGFGIQGMQKRARDVEGKLEISSIAGTGTTVRVMVPIHRQGGFGRFGMDRMNFLGWPTWNALRLWRGNRDDD